MSDNRIFLCTKLRKIIIKNSRLQYLNEKTRSDSHSSKARRSFLANKKFDALFFRTGQEKARSAYAFIAVCESARFIEWHPRHTPRLAVLLLINPFKQIMVIVFDFKFFQKLHIFMSKCCTAMRRLVGDIICFPPRALSHTAINA